jgi:hypothetical protein
MCGYYAEAATVVDYPTSCVAAPRVLRMRYDVSRHILLLTRE